MACVIKFPGTFNFELSASEVIRDDIADAVIDALELHKSPRTAIDETWEDWSALGLSDPVSLPPIELEF